MKNSSNERLSEHLLNIDARLLENAHNIDDAEKLRQYTRSKNKKHSYFIKIAVIAAALALLVGSIFAIPALFEQGTDPWNDENAEEPLPPPWVYDENESVTINSIDSLNYYSAMLILSGNNTKKEISTASQGVLADTPNFKFVSEDIYYYELDPDEVFTISKVIFFKINVTDPNSFLASKVGMGVVDVVITENNLDNMITFKNGDRFYSCLENGWSPERRDFSTHKYIDGFCIVKNLEQENFSFYVKSNRKEAVLGFEAVSDGGSLIFTNSEHEVMSNTYVRESTATFTATDLQKYFQNEDIAQPDDTLLSVCSNGNYTFELYSDGSFIYKSADENSAFYKNGRYVWEEDRVILQFLFEEEVIEQAECDILDDGENGFWYNGEKFVALEPTGGGQP